MVTFIYACCGDADVVGCGKEGAQQYDPLLTFYRSCLVMITANQDIQNSIANGSMCIFDG